uniref:Uncharacterized protein n=1 Tax=Fagus sylvatica TaxID=28930 RepID=A0A2N9ECL1_FAGSY
MPSAKPKYKEQDRSRILLLRGLYRRDGLWGVRRGLSHQGSSGKRAKGGGGVSGVLKYFKQKKVATVQEEEFHRFRVMHNRLLQWRFVNPRAEAAMVGVKRVAEADVVSIYQALSTAMGVMNSIEATITKFISKQIETVLFLVTELRSTFEQEDEYMEELDMAIALVATLLAKEESVQVHLIQAAKESRRGQCH